MDLEGFLEEALRQQSRRRKPTRQRRKTSNESEDYASRLAEKALYRRLLTETHIAQDGIRFIWWFSHPNNSEGRSLDDWRRAIDKAIIEDRRRREKSTSQSEVDAAST